MSDFIKRVGCAQNDLKAPKSQYNSFGKYSYRSCEDILEAAKPICLEYSLVLVLSDTVKQVGERYYVEATATLYDTESDEKLVSTASAREAETKKGMDDSQITGTASSYARKYALNGLFNIDDTKDADTNEYHKRTAQKSSLDDAIKGSTKYVCSDCGKEFKTYTDKNGKTWTAKELYTMSQARNADGKARCAACRKKYEKGE